MGSIGSPGDDGVTGLDGVSVGGVVDLGTDGGSGMIGADDCSSGVDGAGGWRSRCQEEVLEQCTSWSQSGGL